MKPIKTIKIIKPKQMKLLTTNVLNWNMKQLPKKPNKKLSYPQAQKTFFINPFGDWDKDKVPNWRDCKPFDKKKHAIVPEGYENVKVHSHFKPGTYKTVFKEAEQRIPDIFGRNVHTEEEYSQKLHCALQKRKQTKHNAFKKLVGEHTINVPMPAGQTQLIHHYIHQYLTAKNPNKDYIFDVNEPNLVTIINEDNVVDKRRISKALGSDAPPYVAGLLTHLVPRYRKVKVLITDYPVDIAMKSTWPKDPSTGARPWVSCEELGKSYEGGVWHDIAEKNAIAYFFYKGTPGVDVPSGRVMLRWGKTAGGKIEIGIEKHVYPFSKRDETVNEGDALRQALQKYLQSKGYFITAMRTPYSYEGYSDTGTEGTGHIRYAPYPEKNIGLEKDIHYFKRKFAADAKIPKAFMHHLAHETAPEIVETMATRKDLPEKYVKFYARSTAPDVRRHIAKRPEIPEEVFKGFVSDPSIGVRKTLISYQPPKKFKVGVTKQIMKKPEGGGLHPEMVETVLAKKSKVQKSIAETIMKEGSLYEKQMLSAKPGLHRDIVKKLLEEGNYDILINILQSNIENVSEPDLIKLAMNKENASARHAIASNIDKLPVGVINTLSKVGNNEVLDKIALSSVSLPTTIQETLYRRGDNVIHQRLSGREDLGWNVGLALSGIKNDNVLNGLINNYSFFKRVYNADKKKRDMLLINAVNNYRDVNEIPERVTTKVNLPTEFVKTLIDKANDKWAIEELSENRSLTKASYRYIFQKAVESGNNYTLAKLYQNPSVSKTLKGEIRAAYVDGDVENAEM